jgi:hypothetical protein
MESDFTFETQSMEKKPNYIVRLFKGDIPLPITYWGFGFLINKLLFSIIQETINTYSENLFETQAGTWFIKSFPWFTYVYFIFICIAIWNSAGKYEGINFKKKHWAKLARITVVLSIIGSLASFAIAIIHHYNPDRALEEEFFKANRRLPKMIDSTTRLDAMSIRDKDLFFSYTLINTSVEKLDVDRFTSIMAPKLKEAQCNKKPMRVLLDEGRKIIFSYKDESNNPVTDIIVQKSDCP